MIRCPTTDRLVPVGIDTDKDSFTSLPDVTAAPFVCPECGKRHAWTKSDAVLETTCRPQRSR